MWLRGHGLAAQGQSATMGDNRAQSDYERLLGNMHEQSGDGAMTDLVGSYFRERERRSAGEELLPWWPRQLVTFDQAVYELTNALFRHPDWATLGVSHERANEVQTRISERIADLMAQGHAWPASANILRLDRAARLAQRRNSTLTLKALNWQKRHTEIAALLSKLGAQGQLPGAVVVDLDGSMRSVTPEAWSSSENWDRHRQRRKFSAGDELLSPEGTLCLPAGVVSTWCGVVRDRAAGDLATAQALLCGAKLPEQSWKDWLNYQGWEWNRRITGREASAYAARACPQANADELKRVAKTIEQTVNRDLPSNKMSAAPNTRKLT